MRPYLLDTNVLLALAWPSHLFHLDAGAWFSRKRKAGFRTCPLTETGFVRISSNPSFTPEAVAPAEALALLKQMVKLPEHGFWSDDLCLQETIGRQRLTGHRQVTDAYLLALAAAHEGVLATFDRGVAELARRTGSPLELIR